MEIPSLKVSQWEGYNGLLHGFMGRRGGKSAGAYEGLNASYRVGDDPKVVSQNVCDMKLAVGIHDGRIVTMKQMHGDAIVEVKDRNIKEAGEADGMVTAGRDIYLGVLTADCVPILFVAPGQKIIAAVHAGWRGTLAGIAVKMVRHFEDRYGISPEEIEAALGPAIGSCCYEIKDDVSAPLIQRWGRLAASSLTDREGKAFLDLRGLNCAILEESGIPAERIFSVGSCTRCSPQDYFSYRREGHETGRQISFVGWLPT